MTDAPQLLVTVLCPKNLLSTLPQRSLPEFPKFSAWFKVKSSTVFQSTLSTIVFENKFCTSFLGSILRCFQHKKSNFLEMFLSSPQFKISRDEEVTHKMNTLGKAMSFHTNYWRITTGSPFYMAHIHSHVSLLKMLATKEFYCHFAKLVNHF